MTEHQATMIAKAIDGETWQSGGGIWLAIKERTDGRCVVHSGDAVCEYRSPHGFAEGEPPLATILQA